tara:strand:- start:1166 stop:1570 length:405 start_codon:yes stop_codon:yes gene_type:complete
MNIKSPQTLISEASKDIKTISADEALSFSKDNQCNLIDIREEGELDKTGSIESSTHIPRGLLEFSLNTNSPLVQNNIIDINKEIILFCAAGGRSALAAKTLKEMGFKNVSHIEGGFGAMKQIGFKIKKNINQED